MADPGARPVAVTLWRDPVILAILGFCVLVGVWYLVGLGGDRGRAIGFNLSQPVLSLGYVVLCRRVARVPDLAAPTRRVWSAASAGALCYGTGELVQMVLDLRGPVPASTTLGPAHQVGLIVGVGIPVVAVLTLPTGSGSRERLKFWLDASTVMAGAAVFAWYFSVGANAGSTEPGNLVGLVLTIAVQLVGAFALVKLLLTGVAGMVREAAICGAIGIALQGLATGVIQAMGDSPWVRPVDAAQMLPGAMVAVAPRIQELRVRADPALLTPSPKRPYTLLPYLAVAATLALLVVVLATDGIESRVWGVLVGVVVSTGLVIARQLAAFSENAELLAQLDASLQELRRQEQLMRHQASHDHLTQLANRSLFTERARLTGSEAGDEVAVIVIDLDEFKPINDDLGHHVGDAVLVAVAERLRSCVRPLDTVARLGGDEFAMLLPEAGEADAAGVVERITTALAEPVHVHGHVLGVRASIGLAAGRSRDLEALLRDADHAMYEAKRNAKGPGPRPHDGAGVSVPP